MGASPWELTGLDTFYVVGNVGIGTTTPLTTLEVVGTSRFDTPIVAPGIGTDLDVAFELFQNGVAALRIEPSTDANLVDAPSIVGGHAANNVADNVGGATIAGGGSAGLPNQVAGSMGAIGGGLLNTAGGEASTVPGGEANSAGGSFSLAAGRRARVRDAAQAGDDDGDEGTFVWADSTDADFESTGPDQFLIRATGGVGIGVNDPQESLEVHGNIRVRGNSGLIHVQNNFVRFVGNNDTQVSGASFLRLQTSAVDRALITNERFTVRNNLIADQNVGIGRDPAANVLEVEGNASKSAAGDWLANSDRRIKQNIETVTNALDTLDRVRLVSFKYKDDYRAKHNGVSDGRYLNVIAQEFAEVFPDHVKGSGERLPDGSEILQVDTYPLTIYSAAAIQELHDQVRAREAEIGALQTTNASLAERLAKLEVLVQKLSEK